MQLKFLKMVSLVLVLAPAALAKDLTAFDLIKAGDDYVGKQSKDKVVQIRSERSINNLTPNIWYVVYYDPDATLKAVQVKFAAGQKTDVSHPFRLLEPITGDDACLDKAKLNTDSDKALDIATHHPLLKSLTLKATEMKLTRGHNGPEWRVKIWAAKLSRPDESADIGIVTISAADGSILKADLTPSRVQ